MLNVPYRMSQIKFLAVPETVYVWVFIVPCSSWNFIENRAYKELVCSSLDTPYNHSPYTISLSISLHMHTFSQSFSLSLSLSLSLSTNAHTLSPFSAHPNFIYLYTHSLFISLYIHFPSLFLSLRTRCHSLSLFQ